METVSVAQVATAQEGVLADLAQAADVRADAEAVDAAQGTWRLEQLAQCSRC